MYELSFWVKLFYSWLRWLIALVLGISIATPLPAYNFEEPTGETMDVTVMSFNVYIAGTGKKSPENRGALVAKTLRAEMPDSFGLQEANKAWVDRVSAAMPEYAWVGVGRDDGAEGGEYSPVFYLKDKYSLVDSGTFWLSETPDTPSKGWDAMYNRICTWAILEDKASGEKYAHFNAHMDHIGAESRANSAKLIAEKAGALDMPVVITGDFNTDEGTEPYNTMIANGFMDTKYAADSTMSMGTYHNFGMKNVTKKGASPIDFIFTTYGKAKVDSYKVLGDKVDGAYSSDHYPVVAKIRFSKTPIGEKGLRVMSFNLRFKDPLTRLQDLTDVIASAQPDVIGTQEGTPDWMHILTTEYNGVYGHVGVGRDDGKNEGEHSAIFYRLDKYSVVDSGTFWLSKTPDVPSKDWDSSCNRICTWAVLESKVDGKQFAVLNTHLDHVSAEARVEQIKIVKEKADSFDIPVVITGDLNATDEDPSIKTLSDGGYTDSRYAAPITDDSGTYNGYEEGRDDYERIDYIFFNGGFEVTKYDVVDGIFASDHFAIYSDLEFAEDIA
ncbi:MAG: endonuclease/exonuclease/phosphatase family protein [Clostridia bacterium]|nr:endonuclease/exonuclease/phosphatase family protein [Clostridia bacterium]